MWLEGDLYKVITLTDSDPLGCAIYRHGAGCHGCRIGANCHSTGLFHTLKRLCRRVWHGMCVCDFVFFCVHFVSTCACVWVHMCVCCTVCTVCTCVIGMLRWLCAVALQRFNIRQCLPATHLFYSSCLPQCRLVCSCEVDILSFLSVRRVMCEVTHFIDTHRARILIK